MLPKLFVLMLLPGSLALSGCHGRGVADIQSRAQAQAELSQDRQELAGIPPPVKSRYMSIRSFDGWDNPSITVQPDMLTVQVTMADQNPASFGAGGMLRPTAARRQQVNISVNRLAEAMAAIPPESWPYGRVVAVEEAHHTPDQQEPTVRRNMEAAISTLNDLGLEVYDLHEGSLR